DELPDIKAVSQRPTDHVLVSVGRGRRHSLPEVLHRDCPARRPDRRLQEHVLELSDVARPGVLEEERPCPYRKALLLVPWLPDANSPSPSRKRVPPAAALRIAGLS